MIVAGRVLVVAVAMLPTGDVVGPDGQVMDYDSCYQQPVKPTVSIAATQGWRISRGILDSSNYSSLNPGYYVVFTGVYDSASGANAHLQEARDAGWPLAYTRQVTP